MRISTLAAALSITALVGCTPEQTGPEALTYDEYKARAYVEPETGLYIINGDEAIETEAGMMQSYENFLQSLSDAKLREEGFAVVEQPSIVNTVNGKDDVWPPSVATNITYCVKQDRFYTRTVQAMNDAAAAWEAAAGSGLNFVHDTSQDSSCTNKNTKVVFNVRTARTKQYLARAFFPSYARSSREVIIATDSYGNISPWTLTGIVRHELGHTIGLRHEHTRPESGECFENNSWRALTPYDSASVMHYPQCNGTNNGDLVLTNSDKSGAAALY